MINKFLHPNGGSETYIFALGDMLKKHGHQVEYFGMEHDGRCVGNSVNSYTSDMDFHSVGGFKKITYAFKTIYSKEARLKIRKVLDDFNPDVCHINNFNYQLTPSIILEIRKWEKQNKKKCKIIYTAHDYQLVCPNHMCNNPNTRENCEKCIGGNYINCINGKCIHGSTMKSIIGFFEATYWNMLKVYKNIDAIICCSGFLKNKLDSNPTLAGKTMVVHNFLTKEKSTNDQFTKKDYVLYFGRYSQEKGIETLIDACSSLPGIDFIFAGKGDPEIINKIESLKNAKEVGFKSGYELEKLIREAKFSVYPSEWYENCPFSIIESQMFGTPVIASRIGGIPELVEDNNTGMLFECKNKNDLASKIQELYTNDNLREKMIENCLNKEHMTEDKYYNILIDIYSKGV